MCTYVAGPINHSNWLQDVLVTSTAYRYAVHEDEISCKQLLLIDWLILVRICTSRCVRQLIELSTAIIIPFRIHITNVSPFRGTPPYRVVHLCLDSQLHRLFTMYFVVPTRWVACSGWMWQIVYHVYSGHFHLSTRRGHKTFLCFRF